jgi:NADH-quinone oxidoreductase subunit E
LIELGVLLLEGEAGRRRRTEQVLADAGYSVRTAGDGADLLDRLEEVRPSLVILDLDLPHGEGLALLKAVHDAAPGVPILGLSASPTVEGAVEAMRRGAWNYVGKSGPASDLTEVIAHAVERERMEKESRLKARARRVRTFDSPAVLGDIDRILSGHRYRESMLISYLQDVQKELNYLPQDAIRFVAQRVSVSLPRVYGIATFYRAFSLKPRGRHIIHMCMGTACHVRGASKLLEAFERELGIESGETTYDDRFSLEPVRCIGCCGLAPVFTVDGKFYGKMTQEKVPEILDRYE